MLCIIMEDDDVWLIFNLDLEDIDGSVNWCKFNMWILCLIVVFVYVFLVNIDILCYMLMILNYMVYVSVLLILLFFLVFLWGMLFIFRFIKIFWIMVMMYI